MIEEQIIEMVKSLRRDVNGLLTRQQRPGPLKDISSTSLVTGWSSFTTKVIKYKKIGKTVHVWFDIRGTSNGTSAVFRVEHNSGLGLTVFGVIRARDNSGARNFGTAQMPSGNNDISCTYLADSAFTASGTKEVSGYIVFEAE